MALKDLPRNLANPAYLCTRIWAPRQRLTGFTFSVLNRNLEPTLTIIPKEKMLVLPHN